MKKMLLVFFILIIVSSPWFVLIIQRNLIAGTLTLSTGLSLISLLIINKTKLKKILIWLLLLFIVLQVVFLKSDLFKSLIQTSDIEKIQLSKRENIFDQELKKLFLNKFSLNYFRNFSLPVYKIERNLFYSLDINQYFFNSHPRERGSYEFDKFYIFLLPFFLFGIFIQVLKNDLTTNAIIIFLILLNISLDPNYFLGPIFMFPVIIYLIFLGGFSLISRINSLNA